MGLREWPGPDDATTSAGTGSAVSLPAILAPTPRRPTSSSILAPEESSDGERYDSRNPLPNTPLQPYTPSVLNLQLPLNAIPDMPNGLPSGGGNVHTPRHGHSRVSSWGSARNSASPSSKKSTRFSPNLTTDLPLHIHDPPPRGATPIRSAMRQTPSPARAFPQSQLPTHSPDIDSVPNITIIQATPPSPTVPTTFGANRSPAQPPNRKINPGGSNLDDNDEDATPGQRIFRSRSSQPANLHSGAPLDGRRTKSPSERESNDGEHSSSFYSAFADSHARMPTAQSQNQPQTTSSSTSQQNQTNTTTSTNQSHPTGSSQQRSSGAGFHTSWQAPRPPSTCSPVTPGAPWPSTNAAFQSPSPSGSRYTRPTHTSTHTNLPHINTSFRYPAGGQHPRSSHTGHSQGATPHGPARTAFTPANGSGRANVDVNSVIDDLLSIPPTSVTWQTNRGVLAWTPHPGLPNSGPNLLGGWGGNGNGNGPGGGVGNADGLTGGYPMPGTCPTWTPGAWPPAATSTSATSRKVLIQPAPWMIPNPSNPALPHIMWDISQLPTTANRITGNHVIVSLANKLDDVATQPAVDRLVVVCQVGVAERFWGHIEVKASGPQGVTVWDVFNGIYEYFQKRVGRRELNRMKELLGDERLEEKMADAYYQRIRVTPSLPGYELKQGLKRVDCLGDRCFFWGLYVSYNCDDTWQLNLGLVNRRRT